MSIVGRWIMLGALLLAVSPSVRAASSAETRAYDAATGAFRDGFWARAESEFAQYSQNFTNSPRLAEARLYQARARLNQTNYSGALDLLSAPLGTTNRLADQYLFWRAEALLEKGDALAAADAFGRLVRDFPASPERLEAMVREALAASRLQDWPRVLRLQTNAVFVAEAHTNAANEIVVRGYLVLGEAQLAAKDYPAATAALRPLANLKLTPQLDWERLYLLCRTFLAQGQTGEALQASTNLLAAAGATGNVALQAQSAAFQADLLERLGRPIEAIAAYQRNLADGFPADRQQQALLKIAELSLAQGKVGEAIQTLDQFLQKYPKAGAADLALVTLGELRLRQIDNEIATNQTAVLLTNTPAGTNLLLALGSLQDFANRYPESSWRGRGELYLGWCFWLKTNWAASQAAFKEAAERLPDSTARALAYFKLADVDFKLADLALRQTNLSAAAFSEAQRNLSASLTNYGLLIEHFENRAEVRTNLFEPALYQLASAALRAGNLPVATNAVARLVSAFPNGFYTDRAVLLTGQAWGRQNPAGARQLLESFVNAVPDSTLRPQVELAIARTYEQEGRWPEAIEQYQRWLVSRTNQPPPIQAQALYSLAAADFQGGQLTNALTEFTNLVGRFPDSEFAPQAQWWVADYYFNQSDWVGAEKIFQAIYQNTNTPPELADKARMMAGRVAYARQSWEDAKRYFSLLTNNTNSEPLLRAQAYLAIGDTFVSQDSTNKPADYQQAIAAYNQVGSVCPTNPIAILALGARGNCCLQFQDYVGATNAYLQVINADPSMADAAVRSSAKVGLAVTFEKIAQQLPPEDSRRLDLLGIALDQCLDVFYHAHFLRDGEKPDLFWTIKAGHTAGHLLTETALKSRPGALDQALHVYEDVQRMFPSLPLDSKINALKLQLQALTQTSQ